MNSKTLQEIFPEVYRAFFAKCQIVCSAPGSFFWAGGLTVIYGGIGILQKIPLRVYVGLEEKTSGGLVMGDCYNYLPRQCKFEKLEYNQRIFEKIIAYLNNYEKGFSRPISGRIHFLFEIPYGAGLNSSGAISVAISCLFHLLDQQIQADELKNLTKLPSAILLANKIFDKIFRLSWKLEAIAHIDVGSGSAPFCSFINTASPIAFFSEKRSGTYSTHPLSRCPSDLEGHYEVLDNICYSGYRLKDLFGWHRSLICPLDFGLFYLGNMKRTEVLIQPLSLVQKDLAELEKFICGYIKEFNGIYKDSKPSFCEMTNGDNKYSYWEKGVDFYAVLSVKALYELKKFLETGALQYFNDFAETENLSEKIHEFFTSAVPSSPTFTKLANLDELKIGEIRFFPDRPAGGDLLFAVPVGYIQEHIEDILRSLRAKINPLISLDYASWLDGFEEAGVKVEQFISQGLYSPFISSGSCVLRRWLSNGRSQKEVYSSEEYKEIMFDFDLLLDEEERKIYIKGDVLDSDDIPSSKATIEILKVLLDNIGHEVKSNLLPESYRDRNEMQSKIVSPLLKALERRLDKKLKLDLNGGLGSHFTLRLDPSEVEIAILEKRI